MEIIDKKLLRKLQETETQIRLIKKCEPRFQKMQAGMKRLRDTQRAPITSECFQNIEFHPPYSSLTKG